MATKIELVNLKQPKIRLLDQKNKIEKEKKKLSKILVWILILLFLVSLFELILILA